MQNSYIISTSTDMIELRATNVDSDSEFGVDGPNTAPFKALVHKDLLCFYSPYHRAALKGEFAEAKQDFLTLDLPATQARRFVSWLYIGFFLPKEFTALYALYVFGDQTENMALCRFVMSKLVQIGRGKNANDHRLSLTTIEASMKTLNMLPTTSPLFRYIVDNLVNHWDANQLFDKKMCGSYDIPKEALFQIMSGLASKPVPLVNVSSGPVFVARSKCPCCQHQCNYHDHESMEEWKAIQYTNSSTELLTDLNSSMRFNPQCHSARPNLRTKHQAPDCRRTGAPLDDNCCILNSSIISERFSFPALEAIHHRTSSRVQGRIEAVSHKIRRNEQERIRNAYHTHIHLCTHRRRYQEPIKAPNTNNPNPRTNSATSISRNREPLKSC